ncbi:hypothetical protein OG245_21680 [Streptomyces sp. NBC_01116]
MCEGCRRYPVIAARCTVRARDLLCRSCAESGRPRRVDLFPPYGIYRLHRQPVNRTVPLNRGDAR